MKIELIKAHWGQEMMLYIYKTQILILRLEDPLFNNRANDGHKAMHNAIMYFGMSYVHPFTASLHFKESQRV